MRARDIVELRREVVHLALLKKPTKKQAGRLREIAEQVDGQKWYPRPPRPPGDQNPDILGIHWRSRVSGGHMTLREMRRANRFGHHGEQPKRSRRQRQTRKRRTGGVR